MRLICQKPDNLQVQIVNYDFNPVRHKRLLSWKKTEKTFLPSFLEAWPRCLATESWLEKYSKVSDGC